MGHRMTLLVGFLQQIIVSHSFEELKVILI
jgi:hypothetical protein